MDDSVEIGTICPTGYRVIHIPRSHSASGVEIIFKHSIRLNTSLTDQYQSFELMDFHLRPTHGALCKNSACLSTPLAYQHRCSWKSFLSFWNILLLICDISDC